MKKLLALILVLTLVLSMGSLAFADDDWTEVEIKKNLTLTNDGTVNPAETFNFTVGVGSYSGPIENPTVPVINGFSITVGEKETSGFTNINLPEFTAIGVYTYEISETPGSTAGFVYDGETYYLVVTVLNDGQEGFIRVLTLYDGNDVKTDAFKNKFYAGDLVIKKTITGNYAVFTDEFDVTVTLTPDEGKNIKEGPIAISGAVGNVGSVEKHSDETVTIKFKVTHESEVTIANIPYDVSYVVTEDSGEYESNIPGGGFSGKIEDASQSVDIVNDLDTEINTGINLDNLPYILILVGAAVGLVAFTMKRRLSDDR